MRDVWGAVFFATVGLAFFGVLLFALLFSPDSSINSDDNNNNPPEQESVNTFLAQPNLQIDTQRAFNVISPPVDCEQCTRGLQRVTPTLYSGAHANSSSFMVVVLTPGPTITPIEAPQVAQPEGGACCVLILNDFKMRSAVEVFLNPTNRQGVSPSFALNSLLSANNQVRAALGAKKTFIERFTLTNEAMTVLNNGRSEVFFAELINVPNAMDVVAISVLYLTCAAVNQATGQCVGGFALDTHKIVFNVKDFVFGDATVNSALVDFASVAAHEFLHPQGLGDFTGALCTEATMFASITPGETKKRTFHAGDTQCLQFLYGVHSSDTGGCTAQQPPPPLLLLLLLVLWGCFCGALFFA